MNRLNFLIPVYNDWKSLNFLLKKINYQLSKKKRYCNVLIVDDCSSEKPEIYFKNLSFLKKSFLLIKASNDEIKSIKASRWPSLDLKLTGNFYEAESSFLKENELLGGIGVSMPLYDSKLRDTQIKSLLVEQKTVLQNRRKTNRDVEIAFRENKTSLEKLITSKIDNKRKLTNISNNLKQLKSSSIDIRGAEFEIASLDLQRRSLLRELALYNWNEKKLSLENGLITENLNEILLNINKIEKKNG